MSWRLGGKDKASLARDEFEGSLFKVEEKASLTRGKDLASLARGEIGGSLSKVEEKASLTRGMGNKAY